MALNIAAGAPPAFLSKNYLNRDAYDQSGIEVSTGDAFKHRAFDMTRSSKWVSVASSDAVTETYNARMYEGALQVSRTVDVIALLGINLKNFLVEYSNNDGASWTTVPGLDYQVGVADFSGTDKIAALASSITFNRLRVSMYRTQTANQEKELGELIVAALTYQPTAGMSTFRPEPDENVKTVVLADGTIDYTHIYRSDDSFEMQRFQVAFAAVSQTVRDALRAIKRDINPFLFWPEPGDDVPEVYLCRIAPDSFRAAYLSLRRAAGYNISMTVEEVGGC